MLPVRLLSLPLVPWLMGCAMVTRHAYYEPIPEAYPASGHPEARPITASRFHLFGVLLPVIPLYSRENPLILTVAFPSALDSCPPMRISGRGAVDTLSATGVYYRACHYELDGSDGVEAGILEVTWKGETLRTAFHREVDWTYRPFFIPTH